MKFTFKIIKKDNSPKLMVKHYVFNAIAVFTVIFGLQAILEQLDLFHWTRFTFSLVVAFIVNGLLMAYQMRHNKS